MGVDAAKDIIYKRLKIEETGPGYCHFPMYEPEYFEQLASEKIVFTYSKGFPTRKFVSTRARNEALDCRVYAYAAYVGLQADVKKIIEKQNVLILKEKEEEQSMTDPLSVNQNIKKERVSRKITIRQPRKNFANCWKRW